MESSIRNLNSYIEWEKGKYHDVLEALGLLKRIQNGQLWHQSKAWETWFACQRFDSSNLNIQQVSEIDPKIRKPCWIRLGCVGNANLFDPNSQPSSVKIVCSFSIVKRKILSDGKYSIASLVLFPLELQQEKEALELIAEEENGENASSGVVRSTAEQHRAKNYNILGPVVHDQSWSYPCRFGFVDFKGCATQE